LGDLEQRVADLITVADAHHIAGESFDREVLAELSGDEVGPLQLRLPIAIRFDLIDEDRALLASMSPEISLSVTVNVEPPNHAPALNRILPDRRVNRLPPPCDVSWEPDINRQKSRHHQLASHYPSEDASAPVQLHDRGRIQRRHSSPSLG